MIVSQGRSEAGTMEGDGRLWEICIGGHRGDDNYVDLGYRTQRDISEWI